MPIFSASRIQGWPLMLLIDTNVISEARKGERADAGVLAFWDAACRDQTPLFLASVTQGGDVDPPSGGSSAGCSVIASRTNNDCSRAAGCRHQISSR